MQTEKDIAVPLSPTGQYHAGVQAAKVVKDDLIFLRR
jgi:hypothetical protein